MIKETLYEMKSPTRDDFKIQGYWFGEGEKTLAIVGAMRGDEIQQQYRQTKSALNANLNNLEMNKAQAITQATQGVVGAGSKIAEALG